MIRTTYFSQDYLSSNSRDASKTIKIDQIVHIMKKTTKSTKMTAKKTVFVPKTATCEFNICTVNTDEDMVKTIAIAKFNAGYNLDVSEIAALLEDQRYNFDKTIDDVFKQYNTDLLKNRVKYLKLQNDYEWATRPWYKKLLFWKKNPNK